MILYKGSGQGRTVYTKHRDHVCTNSSSVESSVVSLQVLKLDPTFWMFRVTSALMYGFCSVVRWESTGPKQNQNNNSFFSYAGSLNAGALMGN